VDLIEELQKVGLQAKFWCIKIF